MDQLEDNTKKYLKLSQLWQNNGINALFSDFDRLHTTQYLQDLQSYLSSVSTEEAIRRLPQVPCLLDRLSKNIFLMSGMTCYKAVVKCILAFHRTSPVSAMEMRASDWSAFKLKETLCRDEAASLSDDVIKEAGVVKQKLKQHLTARICSMSSTRLLPKQHIDVAGELISRPPLPLLVCSFDGCVDRLLSIAQICLFVCHSEMFSSVLLSVVQHLSLYHRLTPAVLKLYNDVIGQLTVNHDGGSMSVVGYSCCVGIWKHSMPTVEHVLLNTVRQALKESPYYYHHLNRSASYLIRACTEFPDLYTSVTLMLRTLAVKFRSSTLLLLISAFHRCVHEEKAKSKLDMMSTLFNYPECIQAAVELLSTSPTDLSRTDCEKHMLRISSSLSSVSSDQSCCLPGAVWMDVYWSTREHFVWTQCALLVCLQSNHQISSSCLDLLVHSFHTTPLAVDGLSELRDLLSQLKSLSQTAVTIIPDDTVSLCRQVLCHQPVTSLLLMMFIVQNDCSQSVVQRVVELISVGRTSRSTILNCFWEVLVCFTLPVTSWMWQLLPVERCKTIFKQLNTSTDEECTAGVPTDVVHNRIQSLISYFEEIRCD